MLTSSIIKLDRPYPIVYYKGRLLLQVGTPFGCFRQISR